MSIELVMPFNHLILCCPLLLMSSIFPSIRAFSNELPLHTRWPNYWSFNFSISPVNIQGWFPLGLIGLNSFKLVFWKRNLRYDHTTMRKNWEKNPRTLGDNYMWSKGTLKDNILVELVLWLQTMHIQFWLFVTPWIAARQASLSITNSLSSTRLTSIESVMPSSHLILCRPLFLLPPLGLIKRKSWRDRVETFLEKTSLP